MSSLAGNVGGGSSEEEGKPIGGEREDCGVCYSLLESNLIGREKMACFFLFFLGLTSFPKPCVNIGAKNYMAYIKERRE